MNTLMEQWLAGDVTFLERFGNADEKHVAHQALDLFEEIRVLSGLQPTEVLAMAGCTDALYAQAAGESIVLEDLITRYYAAGRAKYIRVNMIRALEKVVGILTTLANGLRDLNVSDEHLAEWVRAGLDFPDKLTGPASHITATQLDTERWVHAETAAFKFLKHVESLPMAIRDGTVAPDDVRNAVADTVADYYRVGRDAKNPTELET